MEMEGWRDGGMEGLQCSVGAVFSVRTRAVVSSAVCSCAAVQLCTVHSAPSGACAPSVMHQSQYRRKPYRKLMGHYSVQN